MDAVERTQHLERKMIPVDLIDPTPDNPNEMTDAEFNMLADNFDRVGFVDPVFVRPLPNGRYRMIGGNHRLEVAKIAGFAEVPATVNTDPEFDDDQEKFQVVRMNVIRGKLSPEKFLKLYQSLSQKYADDVMAESFGFADQEQFKKLVGQVKTSLPEAMQKEFTEAAKEIKTIEDLSKLLNHLFSTFGDTLAYGYMLLDFGGKESVWLRMSPDTRKALLEVGRICVKEKRTVDAIIGGMIRQMAKGKTSELLLQLIAESEPVSLPPDIKLPTEEALQSTAKV
jgi:ParB/RepB/Spo0J family partition protein